MCNEINSLHKALFCFAFWEKIAYLCEIPFGFIFSTHFIKPELQLRLYAYTIFPSP